ncbi:MAG TPA: FtsQ-type POTRA domain-containing protein [Solirubrobacteraceae bacterium]|nr:FtsQ-type POTRA domain-containing protein [Solirubrobacteraceae bacterium]
MIDDAVPRRRIGALLGARRRGRGRGGHSLPARLRRRLLDPRALIALVVIAALLGGGWLWFRDSSLVAVKRVTVTGASGPDAGAIRRALVAAAQDMTTLDVSIGQLRTAVAPYPVVKNLEVSTQFPHRMRIQVIEQTPVAVVSVGGATIAVASDGTLLHDFSGASALPRIPLAVTPGGTRLTGAARGAVSLLAAAPYQLLPHLAQVTTTAAHGLTVQVRNGPALYFGAATELAAKWTAAAAVLADPHSAGASYIDVSDPTRPAAGAATQPASTGQSAGTQTTSSNASTATQTTSSGASTATQTTSSGASTATQTTSSGASAATSTTTSSG